MRWKISTILRRIKIMMLVLILVIANYAYQANSIQLPDLIHIVKDGKIGKESMCIASGADVSSAIDWTFPIPNKSENLPKTASYYVPEINSDFDCNFEKGKFCETGWTNDNWVVEQSFQPIVDSRWEDFRVYFVSNDTHAMIDNRVEIPQVFNIGISIRANNGAVILLCEGWLPDKYPCYLINIGTQDNKQISLLRYGNGSNLYEFKNNKPIFSENDWKNFQLSYSEKGVIELTDVIKKETLLKYVEKTDVPLKPLYLFMSSLSPSLWKIHTNQYLSTNTSAITKFGPLIKATSSNICISLYVSLCWNCSMKFFLSKNSTEEILAEVDGRQVSAASSFPWKEIKLTKYDNLDDLIQIYVEAKSTASDKFWAIDDVRSCVENEIKVTTLSSTQYFSMEDPQVSCHTLRFQEWRPVKHQLLKLSSLPIITSEITPTTIKLSWVPTAENDFQHFYVIKYEGSDLCHRNSQQFEEQYKNIKRLKSNGWIVIYKNEVTIENLVPYTFYSLTFQDPIYGENKSLSLNTEQTDKPTSEELPQNVRIKPTEDDAKVFFDNIKCNVSYGPLVYRINFSNEVLNLSSVFVEKKTDYGVENLLPFTNYNLTIETARDTSHFDDENRKFVNRYNFTTRPDVAPPVKNLEVYETDKSSISIRFDLPDRPNGMPKYTRIRYCHPIYASKCKYDISIVSKCKVWTNKYCAELRNLIRNYKYSIGVSLKNEYTHTFGKEINFTAKASEKEPGAPINVTYKVVDCNAETEYCHLNISWFHPYDQKGAITAFDILLLEIEKTEEMDKVIHDVYRIKNKSYQAEYVYTIKYIPYSTKYIIGVRSINSRYKSTITTIEAETDHIGHYVNQMPTIVNNTYSTLLIDVPALDRRLASYTLTIIMQNAESTEEIVDEDLKLLADNNLCLTQGDTWIAKVIEVTGAVIPLVEIGDGSEINSTELNRTIINKPLKPQEEYCINFIIKNVYRNTEHTVVYHEKYKHVKLSPAEELRTEDSLPLGANIAIMLSAIIVLVVVGSIVYKYGTNALYKTRRRRGGEHIYEAMPFDDYSEPTVAYDATYDKLMH